MSLFGWARKRQMALDRQHAEALLNAECKGYLAGLRDAEIKRFCCHACFITSGALYMTQMIVCPNCGNKRCPKASDHQFACTGSNDAGQPGSVFANQI